jgi:hypothetical protein
MMPTSQRPSPVRTDGSNAFASNTMRTRLPAVLDEMLGYNPGLPQPIRDAVLALRDSMASGAPIPQLELPAIDYDGWMAAWEKRAGETWHDTDWFFAETYVYRLLIQAVRWWEIGKDPFAPRKSEEFESAALWEYLEEALDGQDAPLSERLTDLLHMALWSNRIDLSYHAALAHGRNVQDDDLVVDESAAAVEHVLRHPGDVHIVADNAGTELAIDLALSDTLLQHGFPRVFMHVKAHPTFVSDTTAPDVWWFLRTLVEHDHGFAALAGRVTQAIEAGRLRLAPDFFWNSSHPLWEMPGRLTALFAGASLVILKGDVNYRRMVGDAIWPEDTPFAVATDYFPAPLAALRTMKSDSVVGLQAGQGEALEREEPGWRNNGRRGVFHFRA